ncbi:unnamed protein product [Adineta steineri]|uniref:Sugar phosphate transporter domain-containing protein n=1 Tax=Adineta steineri TaxID=433720 RepID=A0A814XTB9_9BILA|nr:unnamed protein product [Adineta steineri]CAF1220144.1 unnamed protein product [Adineta steineri]CAF1259801.1 unnamed protein product [Adineta steineri]CAF1320261.1 unnamed protein product [Adineta steineri]CAF1358391.1 unnamed protein product [Adineta steineri]
MPVTSLTETIPNKSNVFLSTEKLLLEVPQGLYHTMAILILILWYISSGATLFSNKYILSHLDGDAFLLGTSQLVVSVISGYIQMRIIHMMNNEIHRPPPIMKNVYRDMLLIGAFRCVTVILGLIALKYIAVSFLATIKSSSPLFTVVISRIMLGERTSNWTKLSMIPITIGLCLCSSFELSFELFGFLCALGTNIFDCLQNVFSKLLISGENHRYTAVELQFWASFVACIFQLPLLYYYVDISLALELTTKKLFIYYIFNGFCYHIQSVAAFALMAYISPITHSVVNTVKRALLIWLSVIIFNNPITFLSGIGTLMVITGVILYNDQRDGDKKPGILNVNTATLITWRDV